MPIIKEPAGELMSELNLSPRAVFVPVTVDSKERTVDVVDNQRARGAQRPRWPLRGTVDGPVVVRMDRLNAGAPLLNSHNAASLDDVVGVVERA